MNEAKGHIYNLTAQTVYDGYCGNSVTLEILTQSLHIPPGLYLCVCACFSLSFVSTCVVYIVCVCVCACEMVKQSKATEGMRKELMHCFKEKCQMMIFVLREREREKQATCYVCVQQRS